VCLNASVVRSIALAGNDFSETATKLKNYQTFFFSLFFYFYFLLDQNTETNENKLAKIKPKKKNLTKLVEK
jgi:hypothetical protein